MFYFSTATTANTAVAISTYAMVAYTQKRAWDSQQVGTLTVCDSRVARVCVCVCVCVDDELPTTARVGTHDTGRSV